MKSVGRFSPLGRDDMINGQHTRIYGWTMRLRTGLTVGVTRICFGALVLMVIGLAGLVHDAQGEITLPGKSSEDLYKGGNQPWKIDAQKLSYDQKNGVYEAEGEVYIYSGERSLRAQWAKFDTRKQEAELRGGVFIKFGPDWLKGEYAVWNVDLDTGSLDHGLVFFAKNNFHVQGKRLAKVSESQYEIEDGVITSCDPGSPDWSIRFKSMKVDSKGLGVARNTSFWVRSAPTATAASAPFRRCTSRNRSSITRSCCARTGRSRVRRTSRGPANSPPSSGARFVSAPGAMRRT